MIDNVRNGHDSRLAYTLLTDLAKKYKVVYTNVGNQTFQKNQMINEIQTLAQALIKSEKKMLQIKLENKLEQKNLKFIID